jgi:hypothetical protein
MNLRNDNRLCDTNNATIGIWAFKLGSGISGKIIDKYATITP